VAEFDPVEALGVLEQHGVLYVVVGALAAAASGAPVVTRDLDITPARDRANLERLATALRELDVRLRTAHDPEGVPFPLDAEMLAGAEMWTLTSRVGEIDIVFEPAGTGGYDDLRRDASRLEIAEGLSVAVASLADVVRSKEAAARPKDLAQLPLLRQTLEQVRERERRGGPEAEP
jgi:hypothetical protein